MKKCQREIRPQCSFKIRKCGKKVVLYIKDISGKAVHLTELYLCAGHANEILKGLFKK